MTDDTESARGFEAPVHQATRELDETGRLVGDWLRQHGALADLRIGRVTTPTGAGVANETLLVDASWTEDGVLHDEGLVVRIAVSESLYLDADIATSYRMYRALEAAPEVPTPRTYGYEADPGVLGAPFFVMQRSAGRVPADNPHYTEAGFVVDASESQRRRLWISAVEAMAHLHQVDPSHFSFLERPADGPSGLEQDLAYWGRYHRWSFGDREHPTMDAAYRWLAANLPEHRPTSISWGDSRLCNVMVDDAFDCAAILDWDTVSLAGPEADLAWWIVMEHNGGRVRTLPGLGGPEELVDTWEELTGLKATNLRWHVVASCFKLGAIVRKLNDQMLAAGQLPEGFDIATNSEVIQMLALLTGAPEAGPVTAVLPALSRL